MWKPRISIALICIILHLGGEFVSSNVVYRFGFDFGFGLAKTTFNGTFNITEGSSTKSHEAVPRNPEGSSTKSHERATDIHPTSAPGLDRVWSQQAQLNTEAKEKLQSAISAVTQLRSELMHLVKSSPFIASKIELMTQYLNKVQGVADDTQTAENRFTLLQDFVQLVDDLRETNAAEEMGQSSLEHTTMKLAVEKHKLIELQTQILLETLQAMEAWQRYSATQLLDLTSV